MAIPLQSDDSRGSEQSEAREDGTRSSSHDEALERLGGKILDRAISGYCYEHEICYHSLTQTSGKSDFGRLVPFILVLRRVNLLSLANGLPRRFNLLLSLRGR